jgi:hypothetical protein
MKLAPINNDAADIDATQNASSAGPLLDSVKKINTPLPNPIPMIMSINFFIGMNSR